MLFLILHITILVWLELDHLVLLAHCNGWFYFLTKFESVINQWEELFDLNSALKGTTNFRRLFAEESRSFLESVEALQKTAQYFQLLTEMRDSAILQTREGEADPALLKFDWLQNSAASSISAALSTPPFSGADHIGRPHMVGCGGFGVVFSGKYDGKPVAIKVSTSSDTLSTYADFKREVAMLLRIQPCPHIVRTFGLVQFPTNPASSSDTLIISYPYGGDVIQKDLCGKHAILLDLCGDSLQNIIHQTLHSKRAPIPWKWRIKIAIDIAAAISFIHLCGVLHLDLKPGNVLVDECYVARLCDFGAAASMSSINIINQNGVGVGGAGLCYTPGYAPPDFGQPGTLITHRNDLYAFGQILKDLTMNSKIIPPQIDLLISACQNPQTPLTADDVCHLVSEIYDNFEDDGEQGWDQLYAPTKASTFSSAFISNTNATSTKTKQRPVGGPLPFRRNKKKNAGDGTGESSGSFIVPDSNMTHTTKMTASTFGSLDTLMCASVIPTLQSPKKSESETHSKIVNHISKQLEI
jgi:serine/threonine protein kinase